MKEKITLNLNLNELEIILSSLCLYSSVDVYSPMYRDAVETALDLAIKIRQQYSTVPLTNAFALKDKAENFLDENSDKLMQFFPELVENA